MSWNLTQKRRLRCGTAPGTPPCRERGLLQREGAPIPELGRFLVAREAERVTGEAVESHEKGRGHEVGENQFVLVKDEELEAARREARAILRRCTCGTTTSAARRTVAPSWHAEARSR